MRAAKMTERPKFSLMKQTDIQSLYYMQMPRWLFSDPRYSEMNLDAKVAYTFLLNRFQLSRRNGWINEYGEVFVIFPRLALAKELRICEKRVTAAFRKLVQSELIWEKRCGRGEANQIYLAKVEPIDDTEYQCAPFCSDDYAGDSSKTAVSASLHNLSCMQEPKNRRFKNSDFGGTKPAASTAAEPQNSLSIKNDISKIEFSENKVSQYVERADGAEDAERELEMILSSCELHAFAPDVARAFENAIERLFFSDSFRIGNATLPQSRVRARLRRLDCLILQDAERKLHSNLDRPVKNSTAYIMATVFNSISEADGDLIVDPYLNSLISRHESG